MTLRAGRPLEALQCLVNTPATVLQAASLTGVTLCLKLNIEILCTYLSSIYFHTVIKPPYVVLKKARICTQYCIWVTSLNWAIIQAQIQISALSFASCVTLGMLVKYSGLQLPSVACKKECTQHFAGTRCNNEHKKV